MSNKGLGIAWGAKAIGEVINRTERQTSYLLEQGVIKAARKTSEKERSQWFAPINGLRAQFCAPGDERQDSEQDGTTEKFA